MNSTKYAPATAEADPGAGQHDRQRRASGSPERVFRALASTEITDWWIRPESSTHASGRETSALGEPGGPRVSAGAGIHARRRISRGESAARTRPLMENSRRSRWEPLSTTGWTTLAAPRG